MRASCGGGGGAAGGVCAAFEARQAVAPAVDVHVVQWRACDVCCGTADVLYIPHLHKQRERT
jgi:hypothetical protein